MYWQVIVNIGGINLFFHVRTVLLNNNSCAKALIKAFYDCKVKIKTNIG